MPLQPPPRDQADVVTPHDHTDISAADGLIRRVSEYHLVPDEKIGGRRFSSMFLRASSGPNGGMSVDLQQQIEDAGLDARAYVLIPPPPTLGAVRFEAGHFRARAFQVGFDPIENDPVKNNPHHGQVWGNFSRPNQRAIFAQGTWFVEIDGVALVDH